MAIELDDITSGYNLSKINTNFQKVEDYINDKVLHRADTGVAGEAKMERDLDMDGFRILNADIDGSTISNDRAIRVPASEPYLDPLPEAEARKGNILSFNINTGLPEVISPASGSATDVLNQLASQDVNKGDALVTVKLPYTGGVMRSQHSKNMDVINVLDFGADPTGVLSSAAAFQAALDLCSDKDNNVGHGRALHIPGGIYKIDQALTYSWRNTNTQTDGDTRRLTIFGDGGGCTFINDVRAAPGTTPLIAFDGGQTDPFLRLSISNLRFQRPSYDMLGWGLYFKNVAIMDMRNVDSQWFLNGAVCHDVLYAKFDHCQFGANDMGIRMARLNWTRPNVFLFSQCMFGGNASGCADIVDGANIKFDTCSFEGTGTSNAGPQRTIQYTGAPEEGGIGLTVENCYFENNFVFADVAIESNSTTTVGTHIIEGNTFQRTSPVRYCKGHINLSPNNSGGKQRFHLRANTYKFLGGYTHNAGDFSVTAQTDWAEVFEEGNFYNTAQPPVYGTKVIRGYNNTVVAAAKVTAAGAISAGYNAASVTKGGTGIYTVNFTKPLTSATVIPVACTEAAPGFCAISSYDDTKVQVTVLNTSGVAADIAFNVLVTGVML